MRKSGLFTALISLSLCLSAQVNDPILLSVDGKGVTLSEFEAIFKKNNTKETQVTPESVNSII